MITNYCWQRTAAVRTVASSTSRSQCYKYKYKYRSNNTNNTNNNDHISISLRSYHNVVIGNNNGNCNDTEDVNVNAQSKSMKLSSPLSSSLSTSSLTTMAHHHHHHHQSTSFPFEATAIHPSILTTANGKGLGLGLGSSLITTRSFSTGHPDHNHNTNHNDKTHKTQIENAAKRGGVAVKKGASSIREMIRKYGWTFLSTYFTLYVITLGSLFTSLDTGLLDPSTLKDISINTLPWHTGAEAVEQDEADAEEIVSAIDMVANYMRKYSWTEDYADLVKRNPHTSNLAIAWVATKLTEPVRLGVTLAIVPRISRMMGNKDVDSDGETDVDGNEGECEKQEGKENVGSPSDERKK